MCSKRLKKLFCVLFSVVIIGVCVCVSALGANSNYVTYSDTLQNATTVQNLLTLRNDKQMRKHYIAFRSTTDEYVLLMSDKFDVNGKTVSCDECDIIVYNQSYGSSNMTRYYSSSLDECTLSVNHVVVSDFLDGSSRANNSNYNRTIIVFFVVVIALLAFWLIRRFK